LKDKIDKLHQGCRVLRNRGQKQAKSAPADKSLYYGQEMKSFRLAVGGVEVEIITRRLNVLICGKCFASLIFHLSSNGGGIIRCLIGTCRAIYMLYKC